MNMCDMVRVVVVGCLRVYLFIAVAYAEHSITTEWNALYRECVHMCVYECVNTAHTR